MYTNTWRVYRKFVTKKEFYFFKEEFFGNRRKISILYSVKKIAIIWAWPAWLMAAAALLERSENQNLEISVFEKNTQPGKKLLLSGGGRCNITTSIDDKKILQTKYVRGWDFIKKAIGKFSPKKCFFWFESHGLPLKIEKEGRVFPESDSAWDVLGVFQDIFAKYRNNIHFHYGEWVTALTKKDTDFFLISTKAQYTFHSVIIATWWNAYAHTGSTGDGYAFARGFWHNITPLWPSLSAFVTRESWLHNLSGVTFEMARIGQDLRWGLILTHFGISGPLAFMLSAKLAWVKIEKWNSYSASFSPIADMWPKEWDNYLRESFERFPKKFLSSILSEKLPKRFSEAFVNEFFSHLSEDHVGTISKKSRDDISKFLWEGIPISILERRAWDEFVTAGWIHTDEIDPETMESKLQKNLYFVGEILNVDGYTWWFSLQICWASGYVAGKSIPVE